MAWPGNYAYLSSFVYRVARLLSAELFMQTERGGGEREGELTNITSSCCQVAFPLPCATLRIRNVFKTHARASAPVIGRLKADYTIRCAFFKLMLDY